MSSKILFGLAVAVGFAAVSSAFAATGDASTGAVVPAPAAVESTGAYLTSLDVKGDVTVVSSTATGITVSWDAVAAATDYVIYYDVKSPDVNDSSATYAFSTEPYKTNTATISGLKPGTKYFMMVIALDDKGHESYTPSKEISASTSSVSSFGLSEGAALVTSSKTLVLSFNQKLDASKPVAVSVTSNLDKSDLQAVAVVNSADASKVDVTISTDLVLNSSYSLVVKLATAADGQNVQAGANAAQEFTFTSIATPVMNAAPAAASTGAVAAPVPELTSAAPVAVVTSVPAAAAAIKSLPDGGPAENIVVAMALVLGAVAVWLLRRRQSV